MKGEMVIILRGLWKRIRQAVQTSLLTLFVVTFLAACSDWPQSEESAGTATLSLVMATPSPIPTSTDTPTPVPTPTSTPSPTPTPTTTATPSPSPTPTPEPAVRILYAVPSDRDIEPHYTTAVSNAVHNLQRWYAEQMNGYTFAIESPTPQICAVDQKAAYYEGVGGWNRVIDSVQDCSPVEHSSERHVWVIYIDAEFDCSNTTGELGRGGDGITILHRGDLEGLASPETYQLCGWTPRGGGGWTGGLGHELGHAFGLEHPTGCDAGLSQCDTDALMWAGFYDYPATYLTDSDKASLQASLFFKHRLE